MSLLVYIILLPYVLSSTSSGDDEEKCPGIYKRFSAEHTFCLSANDSCSIITRGVTDTEKEFILQLHNEYRSKVATGQEDEAGGMPSASNMLEMVSIYAVIMTLKLMSCDNSKMISFLLIRVSTDFILEIP